MLGFPSLALKPAEVQRRVVHVALLWRLCQDQVEEGRVDVTATSDPATIALLFSMY
jgi:hypothetical protein